MFLYAITTLLSAFLLFLVQPILGKYILPWYGGGPGVWTSCLLFFQVGLLAGYGYAHLLTSRFPIRKQVRIHLIVIATTILLLPIIPSGEWKPWGSASPTLNILALLAASVGGPYFLLSSTGPLLQSWYGRVRMDAAPYRLYSLSNAGSLCAIVSYPFVIEPSLGLNFQARLWSWSYAIFALSCGLCAARFLRVPAEQADSASGSSDPDSGLLAPRIAERVLWLSMAGMSSIMLMAATNQMCQDVAVIPLLWVLPLGLYLLSFILCFHSPRWYSRRWCGIALGVALAQTCVVLSNGILVDLRLQILSYSFTLFACCMALNGELVRLKPHPAFLTSFYLVLAAGGALGGVFVSLIAPQVFKGYWEFHLGLAGTALLWLVSIFRDRRGVLFNGRPFWAWTLLNLAFVSLVLALSFQIVQGEGSTVEVTRNFFGTLRVLDEEGANPQEHRYTLMHGRIEHGYQFVDREKRYWPTSYFGPNSGLGLAIRFHPTRNARKLRIGVVGLGTGTIAAYGEAGDSIRFYEINPGVLNLSDKYFTYRKDSDAEIDVVLGDARISLEEERERHESQQFDVLAIDAFSSDAIPVHLLTRECYETYRYHLKQDGIMAVHISSRYFDLSPVVRGLAALDVERFRGTQALRIDDLGLKSQGTDSTHWILLTANESFLATREIRDATRPWSGTDPAPQFWTDNYSNLFRLLQR